MDRDVDIKCAQIVGWKNISSGDRPIGQMESTQWKPVPKFSSDLAAAFTLLGWLKEQNRDWEYEVLSDDDRVYCVLCLTPDDTYDGEGPTAAAAITAAFLAAVCSGEA